MNRYFLCAAMLLGTFGLSSCSFHWRVSRKKAKTIDSSAAVANTDTAHTGVTTVPRNDFKAPDTLAAQRELIGRLTPIWEHRIEYKTFSGKARVHFSGPDGNKEFTAHFRIRKDSVIWVNVTFASIPVARILVTQDSFFLLNTTEKEITRLPLTQAAKILPARVDFHSFQNLVVGEPLRDGSITAASEPAFGGAWNIQVEDTAYIQRITYNKTDSTIRTGQLRTHKPDGPQAITAYGDYETISNRRVSTSRTLNIQNGANAYSLDMNFTKADFDEALDYPFNIPKSYTEKKP